LTFFGFIVISHSVFIEGFISFIVQALLLGFVVDARMTICIDDEEKMIRETNESAVEKIRIDNEND
jgi:hypothetical protein